MSPTSVFADLPATVNPQKQENLYKFALLATISLTPITSRKTTCEKALTYAYRLMLFREVFLLGYVPTASMEPTLHEGILILGCQPYGELETGDIIIFVHDGKLLVKRIATCPGDIVEVNGSVVTVPRNCYYVLGDNSEESFDSRYWNDPFISKQQICGKLIRSR